MNSDWDEIFWTFSWMKKECQGVLWSQYSDFNKLIPLPIASVTKVWHEKKGQMTPFLDTLGLRHFFLITPSITLGITDCYGMGTIINA